MTPLPARPSPRLAQLADLLGLTVHQARGCFAPYMVYRKSIPTLHAILTKLGYAHDYSFDLGGSSMRIEGLIVQAGGMGGVMIEDVAGWASQAGSA